MDFMEIPMFKKTVMTNLSKSLLALWLMLFLSASQVQAADQGGSPPSGGSNVAAGQDKPDKKDGKSETAKDSDQTAAPPLITKIEPENPTVSDSPQDLTLTISGPKDGEEVTVTLKSPQSKTESQKITVTKGVGQVSTKLGVPGTWEVTIANQAGTASKPFAFKVQERKVCRAEPGSPQVSAYWHIFWVMNIVAGLLFVALITGLVVSALSQGKWSLGDALSEESSMQPKEIQSRSDVVMVASSSRIIAVFGLTGILALVIGVGYSIVWNLVVCGTAPDLGPVRAFLVGMAAIFAPYLANQAREIFSPSNPESKEPASPAAPSTIKISGLLPAAPMANPAAQDLTLLGTDFQSWMAITLINPDGQTASIPAANIHIGAPTQCRVEAILDRGGSWKAVVTNPNGTSSGPFTFKVTAPAPAIGGVVPANPLSNAAAQQLTVNGNNLMPNVVATLVAPGGAEKKITPTWVNATQIQLQAVLQPAGAWRIKVANPGNEQAGEFPVNVT
jgi:archaellum component FlaG (FlaF/FlaG flagellin family)